MAERDRLAGAPGDDAAPTRPSHYVGIGASAGGLEAIEAFFHNMPADSGLAFIVVQHLSPDYKSLMVELLSKRTEMPVQRSTEGMVVQPDNVYLIPPRRNLTIFHGKLLLSDQDQARGINLPIDLFLRSLAEDQAERAVAIILSGTGSDGMRGIRAVKEAGGMAMVQSIESAKFDGMPRAAISTGLADFRLGPDEMPARLLAFARHPHVSRAQRSDTLLTDQDGLTRIFALLRDRTKVDFTYYKPSTVVRRIERRMSVNQIDDLADYVAHLESYPGEISALHRELLIGVTSFFRDRESFEMLARRWLPGIIERGAEREVRMWVAGCSTGEEAYSLAMLCREAAESLGRSVDTKIFATDIDRDAILAAGAGEYPESIAADLSPRLLAKYFYRRDEMFQIARSIREMVVFAQHNLVKDPPFTNIDLVTCRNLLIYLQPVLQRRALELFNFSINPGGLLFLGSSETIGEMDDCFEVLHHRHRIYRSRGRQRHVDGPGPVFRSDQRRRQIGDGLSRPERTRAVQQEERLLERLLRAVAGTYVPPAVVVNDGMEVVHTIGDTSDYFRLPAGPMTTDLHKMAGKELSIPLATGVQKALAAGEEIRYANVRLSQGRTVTIRFTPLPERKGHQPLVAVFLEPPPVEAGDDRPAGESYDLSREAEQRIADLEQELQFTQENLQVTIEELQATNEELLASNEELQSTNEELQSVNQELYTVNAEYQRKIMELTELTNDVDNLLASTRIGTLFLDGELAIRTFTAPVGELFRVVEADVGRPLADLGHRVVAGDPMETVRRVHRRGRAEEVEVQLEDGRWFLMRALPYQLGPQTFSGVVLTFVDISARKQAEAELARGEARLRETAALAHVGSWDYDPRRDVQE